MSDEFPERDLFPELDAPPHDKPRYIELEDQPRCVKCGGVLEYHLKPWDSLDAEYTCNKCKHDHIMEVSRRLDPYREHAKCRNCGAVNMFYSQPDGMYCCARCNTFHNLEELMVFE